MVKPYAFYLSKGIKDAIDNRGMSSGMEARYERGQYNQIKRRIIATRDILSVNKMGYYELMIKHKLKGINALIIGLPEYLSPRVLAKLIAIKLIINFGIS